MNLNYRISTLAVATLGALALSACQGEDPEQPGQDFISDDPAGNGDEAGDGGAETGDPGNGADEGGEDDDGGDSPDISEADIVQLEGDRLYALSSFSGLTVVDMTNPDDMRSLGTWETDAQPFEMYVENAQAFVMFSDFGFWEWDDNNGYWDYQSSSRLVALDASDPADITVKGEFTLPGRIQDSRRVGDVLYLVTLQDGWCWSCDEEQKTVVTSLDISDEANPVLVEQLEFTAPDSNWDWQRSVESTTERMYLASRAWQFEGMGALIDVVDISAGDGSLVAGAQVPVTGSVFSRWQMNEYQGVLRVISQYGWGDNNPVIETFQIESADSFVPLGSGELTLPMPESLRSVRFDGDRAYAITAEQIDPLFTIDLSDPANPQQIGELEIPGWVYHMETRGDRVLALGFDPAHADGSLNVSLFDVSNFAAPTLRKRVHFGGDWASFAEDQNRIHKAFAILDEEQMILVPHSGWDHDEQDGFECSGNYHSGVQIIDWLDDDLTLRGLAPTRGSARRAFTHKDRIITMSDSELASFEYADRDAPQARDEVALAVNVEKLVRAGDVWVRFARSWYTSEQVLEIVGADDLGSPEPLGVIDLGELSSCDYVWAEDLFAIDDHVFVVQSVYSYDENDYNSFIRVISVDISDPSAPVVDDTYDIPGERGWGVGQLAGVTTQSNQIAQLGQHLVVLTEDASQNYKTQVQVVDLSDPTNIELTATLERPTGQTQGQLSVLSDTIVSWHTEPVEDQPGKVRFYFDRLDLSGAAPSWSPKVNVPGIIVAYDAEAGRAFTVDFKITETDLSVDACFNHPNYWDIDWDNDYDNGTCILIERTLERLDIQGAQASLVASFDIEGEFGLQQLLATDSRIFAKVGKSTWYGDDFEGGSSQQESKLVVVDLQADVTTLHEVDGTQIGKYWWITAVEGARAVVQANYGEIALVDASDAAQPEIVHSSLPGWGGCYSPVIDGDSVYCPMGVQGLETVDW